ncbi:MAG TPA: DUF4393 domain-containing protein [Clostridia bacterium]|nr:DUF4393 domain-containing protein [Clostridia bacterium]
MDEKEVQVALECVKEVAKDAYADGGRPILKPTGELVGLVPRAIKAALLPVEKWVLAQEYNLAETKKLLEIRLENVPAEQIVSPEPHIAVPALQYISYCMDNEELRNMYANLLANSMNASKRDGVHPSFVEIIKQMCPDEAKLLKAFCETGMTIPVISVRYENDTGSGIYVIKNFTDLGEQAGCEEPLETQKYFDNLARLGLVQLIDSLGSLTDKTLYEPLKNHNYILENIVLPDKARQRGYTKADIIESYVAITAFGRCFCKICFI